MAYELVHSWHCEICAARGVPTSFTNPSDLDTHYIVSHGEHHIAELRAQCWGGPNDGEWHPMRGVELHTSPTITARGMVKHVYVHGMRNVGGMDVKVWEYKGEQW